MLERELLGRQKFKTKVEARVASLDFVEGWLSPPTEVNCGQDAKSDRRQLRKLSRQSENAVCSNRLWPPKLLQIMDETELRSRNGPMLSDNSHDRQFPSRNNTQINNSLAPPKCLVR